MSVTPIREAVALRMHLELPAIEDAVPCHDRGSLDRAAALLDPADDRAFHTALIAPGPSGRLKALVDRMWNRAWQAGAFPDQPGEHRAILDAVRAGDAGGAVAAMCAHRATTLAAMAHA